MNVFVIGNLTDNVELKQSKNGEKFFANFSIAENVTKDKAFFHRCVVFGKTAEYLYNNAQKGDSVVIFGRLEPEEYPSKADPTIKQKSYKIIVSELKLFSKHKNDAPSNYQVNPKTNKKAVEENSFNDFPEFDDPFGDLNPDDNI